MHATAQTCSDIEGCTECLGTRDCAWYVSTDHIGCVSDPVNGGGGGSGDSSECPDLPDELHKAECYRGRDDRNGSDEAVTHDNAKICASTCSARALFAEGCTDCLGYDYDPSDQASSSRSKCAWLKREGYPDICIHHDRCDETQFLGDTCHRARSDLSKKNRRKKCKSAKANNHCRKNKGCQSCLKNTKGHNCAWFVDYESGRGTCVPESKCAGPDPDHEYSRGRGSCTRSAEVFYARRQCRFFDREDEDYEDATCESFDGMCTQCLTFGGCRWNNELLHCEPDGDEDESTARRRLDNIVMGEPEASEQCVRYKRVHTNEDVCRDAIADGVNEEDRCQACVETQLYVPRDEYHVKPPTCSYINGSCVPSLHEHTGKTCDHLFADTDPDSNSTNDADNLGPPTPRPTTKLPNKDYTSWPEYLGTEVGVCVGNLEADYGVGTFRFEIITPHMDYPKDKIWNRVRLFVDGESHPQTIIEIPTTG